MKRLRNLSKQQEVANPPAEKESDSKETTPAEPAKRISPAQIRAQRGL